MIIGSEDIKSEDIESDESESAGSYLLQLIRV